MRRFILFSIVLIAAGLTAAVGSAQQLSEKLQIAVGKWQVMNNDGSLGGQVETWLANGKLYGKVTKLKPGKAAGSICDLCSGDKKDQPMLGMTIMWDLKPDGDQWADGIILDPDNGHEYRSKLWAIDKDHLSMRGYIGISWFGRTSNWVRLP